MIENSIRPAFGHGRLGHPQSLEYSFFFLFLLRLLLFTHFWETPMTESFPKYFGITRRNIFLKNIF